MLSEVIVNIFTSHITLYLNTMTAQGFYILLRLFLFSHNRQGILTTRIFFQETKGKYPGLNCLPQKDLPHQLSVCTCTHTHTRTHVNTQSTVGHHESICLQIYITQKQMQSWRRKNR